MTETLHKLTVSWDARRDALGSVISQVTGYLALLSEVHDEFRSLQLATDRGVRPATPASHALADQMRESAIIAGMQRGHRIDSDGASHRLGFNFTLLTANEGALPHQPKQDGSVTVTLHVGAFVINSVAIDIPKGRDDLADCAVLRKIFVASVQFWHATLGHVSTPCLTGEIEKRRGAGAGKLHVGWMTYLRNAALAKCIRPHPDCQVDVLGDGVLVTLSDTAPNALNDSEVDRAVSVQNWLDTFRFRDDFSIYGWPCDPTDEEYIYQVTGAPPGTAYVVGFIAFDGYDHVRKVLLYTRLFRWPDSFGTDLDPATKNEPLRLESNHYVALARQQIAAVHYVGATNAIEWHVGVEEKVQALKVLINEWAAIPEAQLRVIHTRFGS